MIRPLSLLSPRVLPSVMSSPYGPRPIVLNPVMSPLYVPHPRKFKCKFKCFNDFRSKITSIAALKPLVNIHCGQHGMSIAASPVGVEWLVHARIRIDGFDEWDCQREYNFGLNIAWLAQTLMPVGAECSLYVEHSEGSGVLLLRTESQQDRRFCTIKLSNVNERQAHVSTRRSAKIYLKSKYFKDVCTNLNRFGNGTLEISATNERVSFSTSADFGTGKVSFKPLGMDITHDMQHKYYLKTLQIFVSATSLSMVVRLLIGRNGILTVSYKIRNVGLMSFCLHTQPEISGI